MRFLGTSALIFGAFITLNNSFAAGQPESSLPEWTVLMFLNGRSDLSEYIKKNVSDIEVAATESGYPLDRINLVLEYGLFIF